MTKQKFVLYIDESGDFVPAPQVRTIGGAQKARNQLVGIIAPDNQAFNEEVAKKILADAHSAAGSELPEESHAKDFDNRFVNLAAAHLLETLKDLGLQPVRLVNREQIDYGGHDSTYTQIVAELIIRLFQIKSQGNSRTSIRLHAANVVRIRDGNKVTGPRGVETISAVEYEQDIREALAFVTVRNGFAEKAREWEFGGVTLTPARKSYILQICDLLSNASVNKFSRIDDITKEKYSSLLGKFDFTLRLSPLIERIEEHLTEGEPGLALRAIAEHVVRHELSEGFQKTLESLRKKSVEMLAAQSSRQRRPQCDMLIDWIIQLERQRFLRTGEETANWLINYVINPLRESDPEDPAEVAEFEYGIRRWHLKLLTHQGRLHEAREAFNKLNDLTTSIAGSVEAIPRLLDGQVAQAVHLIDCLEIDDAIEYLKNADAVFMDMLALIGKKFSNTVRSESRAKVLSTWSQAEALSSNGTSSEKLRDARQLNELAQNQFTSAKEISQVIQYRCQIETMANQFEAARHCLAKALKIETASHVAIAKKTSAVSFELLHWWRLGAQILKNSPGSDEAYAFLKAYTDHPLHDAQWPENMSDYPVQGLLRQASTIAACRGKSELALGLLSRLGLIADARNRPILGAVHVAGLLESAAALWESDRRSARLLLGESPNQYQGVISIINRSKQSFEKFPSLSTWLATAEKVARSILNGKSNVAALYESAATIGY